LTSRIPRFRRSDSERRRRRDCGPCEEEIAKSASAEGKGEIHPEILGGFLAREAIPHGGIAWKNQVVGTETQESIPMIQNGEAITTGAEQGGELSPEKGVHSPHRGGKARRMHGQEAKCFEKE
jgi:hypothetical protein